MLLPLTHTVVQEKTPCIFHTTVMMTMGSENNFIIIKRHIVPPNKQSTFSLCYTFTYLSYSG